MLCSIKHEQRCNGGSQAEANDSDRHLLQMDHERQNILEEEDGRSIEQPAQCERPYDEAYRGPIEVET
eukprot:CAMPEP_0206611538 /NCGR_PEP_ID=MMETSP0325_2-20121206/55342_1 /ASSEMBLY_ACC=CAM_ASM_000347 /TAXON_ID=2866 /ORGANISM="Crypthecodinium cohnii, Strain Seligo" /LENGTH=67 /DNA_ID=CAMNT_0054130835 /DNA_START=53 /DNA_END=256 /DNA_ORIENTATION=+